MCGEYRCAGSRPRVAAFRREGGTAPPTPSLWSPPHVTRLFVVGSIDGCARDVVAVIIVAMLQLSAPPSSRTPPRIARWWPLLEWQTGVGAHSLRSSHVPLLNALARGAKGEIGPGVQPSLAQSLPWEYRGLQRSGENLQRRGSPAAAVTQSSPATGLTP
ncbi:hypothetical protein AAFF_G00352330 [Aldrovandia affinis]|uniref:Uncharacterized protein n=1 Tax=Aldrovandia affinis TaxID=143900 RepID=A0AAD7SL56_9TELE|nr:hypothetical protein AAFF_G00352330 [Aldrovandia affinis]